MDVVVEGLDTVDSYSTLLPLSPESFQYLLEVEKDALCDNFPQASLRFIGGKCLIQIDSDSENVVRDVHFSITNMSSSIVSSLAGLGRELSENLAENESLVNILNESLRDKSVCLYYSEKMESLVLLHSLSNKLAVNDIKEYLHAELKVESCQIPQLLSPVQSIPEYSLLENEVKRDYGPRVRISHSTGNSLIISGLSKGVAVVREEIEKFINETTKMLKPVRIHVGQPLASSFKQDTSGLEECVGDFKVKLSIQKNEGSVMVSPTSYMDESWKEDTHQTIKNYIASEYETDPPFPILEKAQSEIKEQLKKMKSTHTSLSFGFIDDDKLHAPEQHHVMVWIAGKKEAVSKARKQALDINHDLSDTKQLFEFDEKEFIFLSQLKKDQIKHLHPDLNSRYNQNKLTISAQGIRRKIENLKRDLKFMCVHETIRLSSESHIIKLLTGPDKEPFLHYLQKCCKCPPFAIHFTSKSKMNLLCEPNQQEKVKKKISSLEFDDLPFPESITASVIQNEFGRTFCKAFISYSGPDGNTLLLVGVSKKIEKVKRKLENFISEKCDVTECLLLENPKDIVLNKYMQSSLNEFSCKCREMKIKFEMKETGTTFYLKGERTNVLILKKHFYEMVDSIFMERIKFQSERLSKFFSEEDTKRLIAGIEYEEKVCITITRTAMKQHEVVFSVTLSSTTINVVIGDLTTFECDVLVNPSNCKLKNISGLAGAIVQRGGPEIQELCDDFVLTNGTVSVGDVVVSTTCGNLPCKALVHAVGPRWQGGTHNEESLLESVCLKALSHTASCSEEYNSIAFPAISAGIFRFPLDMCASILVSTVKNFVQTSSSKPFETVNFVMIDERHSQAFISALKEELEAPQPSPKDDYCEVISEPPEVDKIIIHHGDLVDFEADVLVNTTNVNLDLASGGGVSTAILRKAGKSLQRECKRKQPINHGDVAVTGSGNLSKCHSIYHVAVKAYNENDSTEILQKSIIRCLEESESQEAESIAFPSIGTGNLNFPINEAASIMLHTIHNYIESSSSAPNVHLVLYEDSVFKVFQHEYQKLKSSSSAVNVDHDTASLDSDNSDDEMNSNLGEEYRKTSSDSEYELSARHTEECHGAFAIELNTSLQYKRGNVTITAARGDISDFDSDVLVLSTTDPNLKLHTHNMNARSVLRKGGKKLQSLCKEIVQQKGPLVEGDVFITDSTGSLKCKLIFHVLCDCNNEELQRALRQCLIRAENRQYSSICFPSIFSGEFSALMIDTFLSFIPEAKWIRSITIVSCDEEDYLILSQAFQNGIKRCTSSGNTADKLIITAYGASQNSVSTALSHINKIIEKQFVKDEFSDPELSVITSDGTIFNELQIEASHIDVDLSYDEDNEVVNLEGSRTSIGLMKEKISQAILQAITKAKVLQLEQKETSSRIQWKRIDSFWQATPYDPALNYEIERSYQKYQNDQCIDDIFTITHGSARLHLNFERMEETVSDSEDDDDDDCDDGNAPLRILRHETLKGPRPSSWDPIPSTGDEHNLYRVELTGNDQHQDRVEEFQWVTDQFEKTMKSSKILKIERIQQLAQFDIYMKKKARIDSQNSEGTENERFLFHGTAADRVESIIHEGFNRSFAGRNATSFGHGTYFAKDASYSHSYANVDSHGCRHMFLSRVLTGVFTKGSSSMKIPPYRDEAEHIQYDSVVNNTSSPTIFVVFHDDRAYPEYLITYK